MATEPETVVHLIRGLIIHTFLSDRGGRGNSFPVCHGPALELGDAMKTIPTPRDGEGIDCPTIHELLARLRQTARTAIEWGEANLDNPAADGDPRWLIATWAQCSLLSRLDELDAELARQEAQVRS